MGMKRVVLQFDITGHYMREFPSCYDAARHVNGLPSSIYNCCVGRCPTAYGFRWRFKDDGESISDMDYSMILEKAYGEVTNLIVDYKKRVKEQLQLARDNGEKEPFHFRLVLDALDIIARDFRKRSDDAFREHTKKAEINDTGEENLKNAVIERMALDFEKAICDGNEGDINEIRNFAEKKAYRYTNLDAVEILDRIQEKHKRFQKKAHDDIEGIADVTERFRRKKNAFKEKNNPYRCPLCGGGMYVKSKNKTNSFLVACSGCSLTEGVTVHKCATSSSSVGS